MSPEQIWYWVSITDQIREFYLFVIIGCSLGLVHQLRRVGIAIEEIKHKCQFFIFLGIIFLVLRALCPNAETSKEIAAIKYGRELQQKRVQDKLFFYKKELNKEKK